MKVDAYPPHGTGDFGVQRSGKATHDADERKGTHSSRPASIISFNPLEDIEYE